MRSVRFWALAGFWALGFVVGFVGYTLVVRLGLSSAIWAFLSSLLGDAYVAEGLIVGVVTGFISVGSVLVWASIKRE
jgi:hypothetical protein